MGRIVAGIIALIVVVIAAFVLVPNLLGNSVTDLVNAHWKPVSADEQRNKAIAAAFAQLPNVQSPNVAAGIDTASIAQIALMKVKDLGVQSLTIHAKSQLLNFDVSFRRKLAASDLGNSTVALPKDLSADVTGDLMFSVGIDASRPDVANHEIAMRALPVFSHLQISKLDISGSFDAKALADLIADALNRYANNVSGALNDLEILRVTVPTTPFDKEDISKSFSSPDGLPGVKLAVSAKPITFPFSLSGLVWLVGDDRVVAMAQYVASGTLPAAVTPTAPSFEALTTAFQAAMKAGLGIDQPPAGAWAALGKALVADTFSSALAQASVCVGAQGAVPTQTFETKVRIPDGSAMNCTPTKECAQTTDCTPTMVCTPHHDERDCSTCLASAFGHCIQHGNDPFCEAAKAAQNAGYDTAKAACEAQKTSQKASCEASKEAARVTCEADKSTQKGLCEAGKEALDRLNRLGNLANLDGSIGGSASLSACIQSFAMQRDLNGVAITVAVDGHGDLDSHIKYVPLGAGYFVCQATWTEDKKLGATVPLQSLPFSIRAAHKITSDKIDFDVTIQSPQIDALMRPGPADLILSSTNFLLSCTPASAIIAPTMISLKPLIPELRGNFSFTPPAMEFRAGFDLPKVAVSGVDEKIAAAETNLAIIVTGTFMPPPS